MVWKPSGGKLPRESEIALNILFCILRRFAYHKVHQSLVLKKPMLALSSDVRLEIRKPVKVFCLVRKPTVSGAHCIVCSMPIIMSIDDFDLLPFNKSTCSC